MTRRILIIEDDADMRDGIALILEADGFEIRKAAHGRAGLEAISSDWRPDLILLDLMMPVMNGQQFRAAQAARPDATSIPVVLLSGHSDLGSFVETLRPAGLLQKPFAVHQLLAIVHGALAGD